MRKHFFIFICLTLLTVSVIVGVQVAAEPVEAFVEDLELLDNEVITPDLEKAILAAIDKNDESVDISSFRIPRGDENIFLLVDWVKENAPLFCCRISNLTVSGNDTDGFFVKTIKFEYNMTKEQRSEAKAAAEAMVAALPADPSLTDLQKALLLHDRLIADCAYDETTPPEPNLVYTIYGALVNHKAVCTGYTRAYAYMLSLLGIPNRITKSDAMMHTWNIVTINGKEYHVDLAWDDPVYNLPGRVEHTYFLCSSVWMYTHDHEVLDFDVTPSDTTYDNAFWNNSETGFQYIDGQFYFIDNEAATLCSWDGVSLDQTKTILSVDEYWMVSATTYYAGNFSKLVSDGRALYFSKSKAVYRYVPGATDATLFYTSEKGKTMGNNIYGLALSGRELYLSVYSEPEIPPKDAASALERYTLAPIAVVGDVSGDGIVSILDVTQLLQLLSASEKPNPLGACDINGDKILSIVDVTYLLHILSEQS